MIDRVVIVGAGGHAQVVADILMSQDVDNEGAVELIGFVDDDSRLWGKKLLGRPVLGPISSLEEIDYTKVIVGIGDNRTRYEIWNKLLKLLQDKEKFLRLIHPSVVMGNMVTIGEGSVICPGVVVNIGSSVGCNAILNTGCTIDHHNHIGDHVHIAPGVHLAGDVTVKEGAFLGIGSLVVPGKVVGAWSVVGAGSVVIDDVPDYTVAVGVPAKVIKRREIGDL